MVPHEWPGRLICHGLAPAVGIDDCAVVEVVNDGLSDETIAEDHGVMDLFAVAKARLDVEVVGPPKFVSIRAIKNAQEIAGRRVGRIDRGRQHEFSILGCDEIDDVAGVGLID